MLADSNFPAYAVKGKTKGAKIHYFQRLYADYCQLHLAYATDKPFAISGLEQRFTQQLEDQSGAGVFHEFRGRCLLWRRRDEVEKLERIDFRTARYESHNAHKPPSWSFMAYTGCISYLDVPGHTVNWKDLDLRLTGNAQGSWLYAQQPLIFNAQALDFKRNSQLFPGKWLIAYDEPKAARDKDKCVVLGQNSDRLSYILIVRPVGTDETGTLLYERAGAGYIPYEWITSQNATTVLIV